MDIAGTKEAQKEIPVVTLGFALIVIIALIVLGYYVGRTTAKQEAQDEFFKAELSGLRSDMDREVTDLKERIENNNSRMDRKVSNHEAEYHNKK